jgi:predicted CXXCH cytochrome family protein
MKRFLIALSAVVMTMSLTASIAFGAVLGSVHDLRTDTGSTQVCITCHAPHNGDGALATGLLWNHAITSATYTLYGTGSQTHFLEATPVQPNGISKLCLSCHDGTVAIDSFGGATGTVIINGGVVGAANFGTNLSDDHPISMTYDLADGGLNPTSNNIGSVTIASVLEGGTVVQCSSCHDVHNEESGANPTLLRAPVTASQICSSCHTK